MNRVFVDTSAIFAVVVETDREHDAARSAFERLRSAGSVLLTSSYVLIETYALLHRRVGTEAVRALRERFEPLLDVEWVDRELHDKGLDRLFEDESRLSLVDAVSLVAIRDLGADAVWAYDEDLRLDGTPLL